MKMGTQINTVVSATFALCLFQHYFIQYTQILYDIIKYYLANLWWQAGLPWNCPSIYGCYLEMFTVALLLPSSDMT